MTGQPIKKNVRFNEFFEKLHVSGLFKYPEGHANTQVQGAQKTESRGVYRYTLSGEVCSVKQQTRRALQGMSVFQQPRSGFTLVEILVAIFILGLVMATVYVSYSGILKTSHQLEEEGNIYKMARTSMDRMIKDLSSLQMSSGTFDLRAEKKTLSNHNFYSLSFWSASHLVFGENGGTGRPAAISYYVQEDEGGGSFSLWRSDLSGAKPSPGKNQSGGFVICQNIDSLNLRFYDSTGNELESWDSSSSSSSDQQGKSPRAVKIELSLVNLNDKEKPYKFMTKVFLPVKKQTP
jgi:prepilin-type N-terminal cleavage/methylation domain-containing protein